MAHVYTITNSHLFAFHAHVLRLPNCHLVPSHSPYLLRSPFRFLSLIQQLIHSFSHLFILNQPVFLNHSNSHSFIHSFIHSLDHPGSTLKNSKWAKRQKLWLKHFIYVIHPFFGLAPYCTITMYPYNLEINKSTVPAGAVNLFGSQITNNPAISSPVPQPVQMTPGVSRSDLLPGNQ